jgi:hypothetical protein
LTFGPRTRVMKRPGRTVTGQKGCGLTDEPRPRLPAPLPPREEGIEVVIFYRWYLGFAGSGREGHSS